MKKIFMTVLAISIIMLSYSAFAANLDIGDTGYLCYKTKGIVSLLTMSFGWKPCRVSIERKTETKYKVKFDSSPPLGYSSGEEIWIEHQAIFRDNTCSKGNSERKAR